MRFCDLSLSVVEVGVLFARPLRGFEELLGFGGGV